MTEPPLNMSAFQRVFKLDNPSRSWAFGSPNAEEFGAHVRKSIPFYAEGHDLVRYLASFFVRHGSVVYEIGSSWGELLTAVADDHVESGASFIGIDVEPSMVAIARARGSGVPNIRFECADASVYPFSNASLVISYYSLQFLPSIARQSVVRAVHDALELGGAFIVFEKTFATSARVQDMLTTAYYQFKQSQGLSPGQILDKAGQLRGVQRPYTEIENSVMLRRGGFMEIEPIFKYLHFEGWLALKSNSLQ